MRKIKHRIRLPKEEEESPSLKKFKTQLGRALNKPCPCFYKGFGTENVQISLAIYTFW